MRLFIVVVAVFWANATFAADHFNILVYHHVSENTPASTSVSPETFREHLQFLSDNNYNLISLQEGLSAIENAQPLPERSVAITFDDGYHNIYDNAWPLLTEFNYPFTVFVATDPIDQGFNDMMTWEQMREMKAAGVVFANHSRDHDYLVRHRNHGTAWKNDVRANIEHAQLRLVEELGNDVPNWFAYPYGEFNAELAAIVGSLGMVGFAQHSGGVWSGSNLQAIPRFAAAGIYSNLTTLKTKLESRPMPINEDLLADMLTADTTPTAVMTLMDTSNLSRNLNCFIDGQPAQAQWLSDTQFSLTATSELGEGRHRFNCTSRAVEGDYFYWFSKPWLVYGGQR